jgi:TRAP-type transport system periplasmic protein
MHNLAGALARATSLRVRRRARIFPSRDPQQSMATVNGSGGAMLNRGHLAYAVKAAALAGITLGGSFAGLPALAQAGVTMKIGFVTVRSGMENWANLFKEGAERRAGARLKVEIYPGGQFGSHAGHIEGVRQGTVEMAQMPPEDLSEVDPQFGVFPAPGLFDGIAHAHRALHDPGFKKAMWSVLDSKDLKIVGFACEVDNGYSTTQAIRSLAGFKGKRIRVLGGKLELEILHRLGATAVPMGMADSLAALRQGTIDGARGGIPVFLQFNLQSVAKNMVRTGESVICPVKFVSAHWFEGLPADLRAIILDEAAKADDANLRWNLDIVAKLYDSWRQSGGVLVNLSPAERSAMRLRLASVGDEVFKDVPSVKTAYDALKAAAARTRK